MDANSTGCPRRPAKHGAAARVPVVMAFARALGASGARLALTALRQLERSGGRYALVSMCLGVGQGIAVVIERLQRA